MKLDHLSDNHQIWHRDELETCLTNGLHQIPPEKKEYYKIKHKKILSRKLQKMSVTNKSIIKKNLRQSNNYKKI